MKAHTRTLGLFALLSLVAAGCRSGGPYGHTARYEALSDEERAVSGAREYDPVMYGREPEKWKAGRAVFFGIVTSRAPGPAGAAYLTLSVRRLEPRNLCANGNDEDTCRVTVSDKDFGVAHARVMLTGEDDNGDKSVGTGSLVRVVGRFDQSPDPGDGAPVLRAEYFRHWPRHFYVTRASNDHMRQ
ncbi:MAG: hypothetical protein JNL38_18075 [Myxococcales bacterium]|jgi:hypothetical protein|nr:hypothetical protein [Myxococcales bacterium]